MSRGNDSVIHVFNLGYRIDRDGAIVNPKGKAIGGGLDSRGYRIIVTHVANHPVYGAWSVKALAHRLAAYQLYGGRALSTDVIVRHYDDNRVNNAHSNIVLGTYSDNALDSIRNHGFKPNTRVTRICANKTCGSEFQVIQSSDQVFCSLSCCHMFQRRCPRPSPEDLAAEVWNMPTTKLAKRYGVTDSTVTDWCKDYGICKPPRGYWAKQAARLTSCHS